MTALDHNPPNPNLLSQIDFRFIMKRSPLINYTCTRINIPGFHLPKIDYETPFVNLPETGDRLTFNYLQADFTVDEDLVNYFEIYDWGIDIGFTKDFIQYKQLKEKSQLSGLGIKSEIVVSILNSHRVPNYMFTYYNAFPIHLSDLWFDAKAVDTGTLNASVYFVYDYFDKEKVIQPYQT